MKPLKAVMAVSLQLSGAVVLAEAVAEIDDQVRFFQWHNPRGSGEAVLFRRQQAQLAGYHPEFGGCSTGTTCDEACGHGFEECLSTTNLALFCFNPGRGQKCCNDGFGSE